MPRYNLRPRPGRPFPCRRPPRSSSGLSILPPDRPLFDEHGNRLIYLYEDMVPEVVQNARGAVLMGHPWVLTYDPSGAEARRRQSTGQYQSQREILGLGTGESGNTADGLDRDEYPPAVALEGGYGAYVSYVRARQNRSAGSLMGQQFEFYARQRSGSYLPFQEGDTFRYAIILPEMAGVEYLGDGLVDASQPNIQLLPGSSTNFSQAPYHVSPDLPAPSFTPPSRPPWVHDEL